MTKISGTVLSVIKLTVNGQKATNTSVKCGLADQIKITTIHLTKFKAGQAPSENVKENPEPEIQEESAEISGDIATGSSLDTPLEAVAAVTWNENAIITMSTISPSSGAAIFMDGREWIRQEVTMQMDGYFCRRHWKVIGPVHYSASEGHSPSNMRPYDCFMWMFPQGHMSEMVYSTSRKLQQRDLPITSNGELLRLFRVLVLMKICEVCNRGNWWSSKTVSKYLPPL